METEQSNFDVIVVGAGISGIGAGYHLQEQCPNKSFVILEGRETFGGTWDLFRYPGVRSDSDMHTMGFRFKPWIDERFIADGSSIMNYLDETISENNLKDKIRYQCKVISSSWSSSESKWTLEVENSSSGTINKYKCKFLMLCGGYYNYEEGYNPDFKNQEQFDGPIIHPQKWPEDLDYKNKKVVIIGSGATAVTIVPAMADQVDQITMLQRSPTYFMAAPDKDMIGNFFKKIFRQKTAYFLTRWKNILLGNFFYNRCVKNPEKVKEMLINGVKDHLGEDYDIETHFTPKYKPWDERLCFVPNADFFEAMKAGKASVVTDHIDEFTETGIKLKSGKELDADIIIKATGLNLQFLNGIDVKVDNSSINISEKLAYKGRMFNDIPNLACSFGYARASWTLGADLSSEYVCKLLNYMGKHGYDSCTPVKGEGIEEEGTYLNLSSGYVTRAIDRMPKQGSKEPWKGNQSYLSDVTEVRWGSITNDDLHFKTANQ
jgi:cation diffusion facilitator CzcD-associated flavoprotein CzcO